MKTNNKILATPMAPMTTLKNLRRFYAAGIFFLLMLTSCTAIHKTLQSKKEKETVTDNSITTGNSKNQTITTEKADTLVHIKSDTAQINFIIPYPSFDGSAVPSPFGEGVGDEVDTAGTDNTIESGNIKLTIHTQKTKTGTLITATAIKKPDSIHVVIDKKIISNSEAQTQTKNNIQTSKSDKEVNKAVEKKRFNIAGMLCTWGILLLIILIIYYLIHKKRP